MGDEQEHRSTVSMPEARRIDTNPPERVRAEDIPTHQHRWPRGKLRCVDCDAEVQAVYSPPKEQSRAHKPYFRRKPVEGGRNQHSQSCCYNIDERIRVIRADSAETLVRDRSPRGRPRYRLVVPEAFGTPDSTASVGGGSQVVAEKLTTVLNTAAKIAALIEDYAARGADPNIEWIAECRGERVEWLNFLYTPPRTWVIRNRLPRDGSELTHPVAVIFLAQEKDTRWGRPHRWAIPRLGSRAATYALPSESERRESDKLFVRGDRGLIDQAFVEGLGKYYIGYGMWKQITQPRGNQPRLTLHVDNVTQIAAIPDDISSAAPSRWKDWRRTTL
jgi:hypothetical protein